MIACIVQLSFFIILVMIYSYSYSYSYSYPHSSLVGFRPVLETSEKEVVKEIFMANCAPQTVLNSFDLLSLLQQLCDGTIVPKDVNM